MVAKYDVFINHRGPDVKETFVSHLYAALESAGFRPFVDAESIRQGTHALGSIDEALRGASVHVAIFSKGYAESRYCLDELCDMLETGKVILPVFFDVEPIDLRRFEDQGPFAEAFKNHRKRGRCKRISEWKEALEEVSKRMGLFIQKDNVIRNEHLMIQSIVLSVKREMPSKMLPSKRRFGLEESLREVLSMVDSMKDDVRVVGLCGMGGIGKTTLAVEMYNHCVSCRQYERHCFLKDVRSNQALGLQKVLLKELSRNDVEILTHEDYLLGLSALECKRVLLVIDDIDDVSQFESLVPDDIPGLGPGSCIVITSRDEDVLKRAMRTAVCANVYKVNALNSSESRRLFNWHAFLSETANEDFGDLAVTITDACGGLPLALEVMGAMLCTKQGPGDIEIWKEAVQRLRRNKTIFGILRISYDRLDEGDKWMFRDIACLMIGFDEDVALAIWKSCKQCSRSCCFTSDTPNTALRTLRDRSLVKVEFGKLSMHDVLRDMGRDIVMEKASGSPEEVSHLWDAATVSQVLSRNKKASGVRGINVSRYGSTRTIHSQASEFACMEELHILDLNGFKIEPDDFSKWSQALRFLRWGSIFCDGIPTDLKLSNLAVLDISGNYRLQRLWEDDATMQIPALRMLFLDGCRQLTTLPDSFGSSLSGLQTLTMRQCLEIERLPDSVVRLSNLKKLDLSCCHSLRELPKKFGSLVNLEDLNLQWCTSLQWWYTSLSKLPASFGSLLNLKDLNLESCSGLSKLPASFGSLLNLKDLNLRGCSGLSKLPASFGSLLNLKDLNLKWCTGLSELPASFGSLLNLKDLNLQGCSGLSKLPASFGSLLNLKDLNLQGCSGLSKLPASFGSLLNLKDLNLRGCSGLSELPASFGSLLNLKDLNLKWCTGLSELPASFGSLFNLKDLKLQDCSGLSKLPASFGSLLNLKDLKLQGCSGLSKLPASFGSLLNLQSLNLQGCDGLSELPASFGSLLNLKDLDLQWCIGLSKLPASFGSLVNLQNLNLGYCSGLLELPASFGSLLNLQSLNLQGCDGLSKLPASFGSLVSLQYLKLQDCRGLSKLLASFGSLVNLQNLNLRECSGLLELPASFGSFVNLQYLKLPNCIDL